MTAGTGDYDRIFEIVDRARALSGAARDAWLVEACGDDATLRALVLELLAAGSDERRADAFAEPAIAAARQALDDVAEAGAAAWRPERIGDYTILRLIGQGGMGVVYEAEQCSPRRRVAIKLLHPMGATDIRLRRLRQEAELLGRLQHPGIAQVFEAGSYDVGHGPQPFFAMEYVDGVDIRTHCERHGLDRAARLKLLARVADAVQHAHEHGVVHRDLKPDNVLVDVYGNPRVLDFGVARATGTLAAALTGPGTADGKLVGTLAYMAPELLGHASNAVTPQVDVYALGVLAFEVLVGRLPWEIDDLSLSRAIALLATRDAPRAGTFDPGLIGDVETILGKALESERARRYASASALAADLRRHLVHRPIEARRPSRVYLVRKFTRRHRGLVAGVLTTLVTLLAGVTVALVFARDAQQQRDLSAVNERRALNGLLQSAEVLLDADRPREALAQLRLVPEDERGVAWQLLRRAAPTVLDVSAGDWRFIDDERIVGSWYASTDDPLAEHNHLGTIDLAEDRRLHELDLDALDLGPGRVRMLDAVPAGLALCERLGPVRADEYLLIDLERELVVERGPAFETLGDAPYPSEHDLGGTTYGCRLARIPQVSDDGRTRLWYVAPDVAEVRRDGAVLRTVRDLPWPGTVRLGPDGGAIAVNRGDAVSVLDLASDTPTFRATHDLVEGGLEAFPVRGGVLLVSAHASDRFAPRICRRFELTPGAPPLEPAEPFAAGFRAQTPGPHHVDFPRDGRFVATAYSAGDTASAGLGDTTTGAGLGFSVLRVHTDGSDGWLDFPLERAAEVHVSPSGERVLIVGPNSRPRIVELDPRDGEPDFDPRVLTLRGHGEHAHDTGWLYHVAVSNDGSLIASAAPWDPLIRLWDTRRGALLASLRRDITVRAPDEPGSWDALMAFDADDARLLVTTPFDGRGLCLVEWDLLTGDATVLGPAAARDASHTELIAPLLDALQPGPRARLSQRVQLVDGRPRVAFSWPTPGLTGTPRPPEGERWDYVPGLGATQAGLGVHPTRRRVALVEAVGMGERGTGLLLVRATDTSEQFVRRELDGRPWCVAYSPDGETLAIGTDEGRVLLLETGTYTQQLGWRAHDSFIYSLAWTPDGTRLVTVSGDETVKIWDTRTRVATRTERGHWLALRARLAARDDLSTAMDELTGIEREAARAELIRRAPTK